MIKKTKPASKQAAYKKHCDVYESSDYDIFEFHECNRPHVELPHLEESMSRYGWFGNPITTVRAGEDRFRILQGHHRFMVAQKLGLPILFLVVDESRQAPSIFELERGGHQSWKMADYVHAYAQAKNESYETLVEFHENTGLPISICGMLCLNHSDANNFARTASTGNLKIHNMNFAYKVANIIASLKSSGIAFAAHRPFILALVACMRLESFSCDRFVNRVKVNPGAIKKCSNREDYIDQIEQAYNFGMRDRILGLRAQVLEVLRQRNPIVEYQTKKAKADAQPSLFQGPKGNL